MSASGAAHAADPWADRVIGYTPGFGSVGYTDPTTTLGSPERFTGEVFNFPGAVTPFNPAFGTEEIVSVAAGGSITVAFDEPVTDDPANPYGIDLIIFGNAGFADVDFPGGVVSAGGALIDVGMTPQVQVSADGQSWFNVAGQVDRLFPTLGYLDLAGPYATTPGAVPSDFTKPVNPALNPNGMTFAQLVAAYDGSGGGTGIDIASTGLGAISYVRVLNISTSEGDFEVDAFADVSPVPAPGAAVLALFGAALGMRRRRC